MLVTSSVSAYGAWPDNPKPIAEDWPVARRLLQAFELADDQIGSATGSGGAAS